MIKKVLLLLSLSTVSCKLFAQIEFKQGWFIGNDGKKTECLIKFVDWKSSPKEFEYRLSAEGESRRAGVTDVREFSVRHISRYIRATVDIDRSSEKINDLTTDRNPHFTKEELFLNVIVEGSATLYAYIDGNLERFFFNSNDKPIVPLVFKKYKISHNQLATNNLFKQQLLESFNCPIIKKSDIESLKYNHKSLSRLFINYNNCINSEPTVYDGEKLEREVFHLALKPHLNHSSLRGGNRAENISFNSDFGSNIIWGLGLEAEYVLPFHRNKWSITVEPTYKRSFKSRRDNELGEPYRRDKEFTVEIDYKVVEIPIGIRYYMFLNDRSKLFVNASYVIDINRKQSRIDLTGPATQYFFQTFPIPLETNQTLAFGLGYKIRNRYSLEARFYLPRDITGNYLYWYSSYNSASLMLGVRLF